MTAEEKAALKYSEALNRHTSLLAAFERSLRITDELYQRLERSMYDSKMGTEYSSQHARDAVSLSRALAQSGAVHARLLEHEAARADAMSDDEKRKFMMIALKKLPLSIRQAFAMELVGP